MGSGFTPKGFHVKAQANNDISGTVVAHPGYQNHLAFKPQRGFTNRRRGKQVKPRWGLKECYGSVTQGALRDPGL